MDMLNYLPTELGEHLRSIDLVYAGVIALAFGLLTEGVVGVFLVPAIAAVVYIAAQAIIEPLLNHGAILTPQLDKAMAEQVLTLYVVFLVADTLVYAIKKAVTTIAN